MVAFPQSWMIKPIQNKRFDRRFESYHDSSVESESVQALLVCHSQNIRSDLTLANATSIDHSHPRHRSRSRYGGYDDIEIAGGIVRRLASHRNSM